MKTNIKPLECNAIYHIYNRGINGETLFLDEQDFSFFLEKYAIYIEKVAETFCYCLLNNHFHFMIKTRSEEEILENYLLGKNRNREIRDGYVKSKLQKTSSWVISNAFASLFKSYAQKINKTNNRTGSLLEAPFRRIRVDNDSYYTQLIYYIHRNPQKHGIISNFMLYKFSSYKSYLHDNESKLNRSEVLDWFGGKAEFEKFHKDEQKLDSLNEFDLD